jgi:hypothetical protein
MVVSVLAFTLPTPGRGAVAVTKDHKKISCLMGPYNTGIGNQTIVWCLRDFVPLIFLMFFIVSQDPELNHYFSFWRKTQFGSD